MSRVARFSCSADRRGPVRPRSRAHSRMPPSARPCISRPISSTSLSPRDSSAVSAGRREAERSRDRRDRRSHARLCERRVRRDRRRHRRALVVAGVRERRGARGPICRSSCSGRASRKRCAGCRARREGARGFGPDKGLYGAFAKLGALERHVIDTTEDTVDGRRGGFVRESRRADSRSRASRARDIVCASSPDRRQLPCREFSPQPRHPQPARRDHGRPDDEHDPIRGRRVVARARALDTKPADASPTTEPRFTSAMIAANTVAATGIGTSRAATSSRIRLPVLSRSRRASRGVQALSTRYPIEHIPGRRPSRSRSAAAPSSRFCGNKMPSHGRSHRAGREQGERVAEHLLR